MMIERIIIGMVLYNSLPDLPRCFAAIQQQQCLLPIHIICIDNASSDDSAVWVQHNAPQVTLIKNTQNIGFARAHNQILQYCQLGKNDAYLPLNPDVVLAPDYISQLISILETPNTAYCSGKLLYPEGTIYSVGHALRRDGYAFNIGQRLRDVGQFEGIHERFGVPGAAPLISGTFIHAIAPDYQLYDSGMFLYYEDVDLDWRTRRAGWQIYYVSQAVAWHRGSSPPENLRLEALTNRYRSILRNAYWRDLLFYNLPLILLHCLFRLIFTPWAGIKMLRLLGSKTAHLERQPAKISDTEMRRWFREARHQSSGMPTTFSQRIRVFFQHHFRRQRRA